MKYIKLRELLSSRSRLLLGGGIFVVALVVVSMSVSTPARAAAGINKTISFQGKVVNSNGTNVADGSYTFRFRIYTSQAPTDATSTCSANSCLWEESKNISTVNGIFQTYLGDGVSLPGGIDFNSDTLYLGVQFNGDTEMNPRIRLSAVPYAFNADKLNGLSSSNFVQLSPASQQTGSINVSSDITTGGTFQGNALDTAAANAINIATNNATSINIGKSAGGTSISILGTLTAKTVSGFDSPTAYQIQGSSGYTILDVDTQAGRVGIATGSQNPSYPLDVHGDIGTTGNLHFVTGSTANIDVAVNSGGAGYNLKVSGGAAGTGNSNGGDLLLAGGAGTGTGAQGLVQLSPTVFTASAGQSFSTAGLTYTLSQSSVDMTNSIPVTAGAANITVNVPDPTQKVAGRILYVTAQSGSSDFTLNLNATRTTIPIAMRQNSTATLIWNGTDWTAAGASSSTTLQAAYDNTLASAGGAEIVLNNTPTANGLTIRNSPSNPINGPVFEVQTSIGTELLAVNSFATEYASNGGAEDSTTFNSNWAVIGAGSVNRNNTDPTYYATGQASVQVNTAPNAPNTGVRNYFSANLPSTATTYQVSFTGKLDATSPAFNSLDVEYSPDGSTLVPCTSYSGTSLVSSTWTKITCTFTSTASATSSQLLIRQLDNIANGRTFYIDNLSVTRNDSSSTPANLQVGGGSYGGNVTLFTLDRSSSPPVAAGNQTLYGSMYYDTTSGRIQCYQANGWGACGSAPDTYVNLAPEYPNAVLGGSGTTGNGTTSSTTPTGVGTMTAEFCSNQANLLVLNASLCGSGQAFNYYHWTSPQATQQTYSIYVTYQLPGGFKKFQSDSTVQLTARVDNTTNAAVTYEMFRNEGGQVYRCYDGTNLETPVTTSANTWQTVGINGNEATGCGFSTSSANNFVIFKINMKATSNANAYVGALSFTVSNQ